MLTFQNIYQDAQEQLQDSDATTLTLIKRAVNQGAKKFAAVVDRQWWDTTKTFSLVANQQFYQLPEDALKISFVTVTVSSVEYTLRQIQSKEEWFALNERTESSTVPEYYFIRGNDEVGIWPIPSANISSGGKIIYERRIKDMSAADYTTGTISISADSASVTGSGTTFTATMVGRYLRPDQPNGDQLWYKIASYSSATAITLENTVQTAVSGVNYTIGEIPDIPDEFHESLIDYACYRLYLRRKDRGLARDFKSVFMEAIEQCKVKYSSISTSAYFRAGDVMQVNDVYRKQSQRYSITGS